MQDILAASLPELSLVLTGAWLIAQFAGSSRRWMPAAAAAPLLVLLGARATATAFLPLTTKFESFVGLAACLLGLATLRHSQQGRPSRLLFIALAIACLAATWGFDRAIRYPSPLLYTVWYLVHVPVSFAAYACWLGAAGNALDLLAGAASRHDFRVRQEANVRDGLLLFSVAMIFGGIWGVVSWGAYFLWDPKIIWSVLAWLYYAAFAHVRYWPLSAGPVRVALALLGLPLLFITYVGTSFMTGSIHAF